MIRANYHWIIEKDHTADTSQPTDTNANAVGMVGPRGAVDTVPTTWGRHPFKMYDADMNLCYEGQLSLTHAWRTKNRRSGSIPKTISGNQMPVVPIFTSKTGREYSDRFDIRTSEVLMDDDIYVLVVERDTHKPEDGGRPIVFEQYTDDASLEKVQSFQTRLGNQYGKTRIAKLQFIEA